MFDENTQSEECATFSPLP